MMSNQHKHIECSVCHLIKRVLADSKTGMCGKCYRATRTSPTALPNRHPNDKRFVGPAKESKR